MYCLQIICNLRGELRDDNTTCIHYTRSKREGDQTVRLDKHNTLIFNFFCKFLRHFLPFTLQSVYLHLVFCDLFFTTREI